MASTSKTRFRPVVWTLALLAASVVWWYMSIYQERSSVLTDLVKTETTLRTRNGESLETLTRLGPDKLKEALDAYERQISFVGNLLPIDTLTVELLPFVTEAAAVHGVEIQGQRPVPRHREMGLVVDGITVTVLGGYHDVTAMMTSLLALPRITHLRSVQIRGVVPRGAPPETPPQGEATFTLVTFSRGAGNALPLAAQPAKGATKP